MGKSRPSPNAIDTFPSHCASQSRQRPFPWGRSPGGKEDLPQTPSTPSPAIVPSSAVRGHSRGEGPTSKWGRSQKQVLTFPGSCTSQCRQRPFPWGRSPGGKSRPSPNSIDTFPGTCASQCRQRPFPWGRSPGGKSRPSPNSIDTFPGSCTSQCRQRPFLRGRSPGGKADLPQTPPAPSPSTVPPRAIRGHSRGEGSTPKWGRSQKQVLTFPIHCASQGRQRPFPWGRSPGTERSPRGRRTDTVKGGREGHPLTGYFMGDYARRPLA